jgi:hypothetical protein
MKSYLRLSRIVLLHVLLPNAIGCLIYFYGRDITVLKMSAFITNNTGVFLHLPAWIKYNAVDGLWLYSFLSAFILLWGRNWFGYVLYAAFALMTCYTEYAQYTHSFAGTGDISDVIAYLSAILISFINLFIFNNYHYDVIIKNHGNYRLSGYSSSAV